MTIQEVRAKLVDLIAAINELAQSDERFTELAADGSDALEEFDEQFPEASAPIVADAVNRLEI